MYVNLIFLAMFIGYSTGIAPIVSYHLGAGNTDEMKSLFKKSRGIILISSVSMCLLAEVLAKPLSAVFVGYDQSLFEMTRHAFIVYSLSFLFSGVGIFGSAFFTALNDGTTSAFISFLRTLVFQTAMVLLLPRIFELDGIWISIVAAEGLAALVTVVFLLAKKHRFHYL